MSLFGKSRDEVGIPVAHIFHTSTNILYWERMVWSHLTGPHPLTEFDVVSPKS